MFNDTDISQFLSAFESSKHMRMLNVFLKGFTTQRENYLHALNNQDTAGLKASVHDIKSIARTILAHDMGQQAEDIEEMIQNGQTEIALEKAPALIPELDHAIVLLGKAIEGTSL
tara:strand:+ start:210 stop:554 length:345 start_codon:yes stop_codon:yes gene_type:complete